MDDDTPDGATTEPTSTSTPAVYLSNWRDLTAVWMARRLAATDPAPRAPRLGELHYLGASLEAASVNQIVDHAGFFRDESAGVEHPSGGSLDAEAWFESDPAAAGTLTTRYRAGPGAREPRLRLTRSYAAVPEHPLLVVRYELTNPTAGDLTFNVLDQVHLNNTGGAHPDRRVHAWYDSGRNALFADMTASGQFFVVLGAFQPASGHQVGDDSNRTPTDPTASAFFSFDHDGTLRNNAELRAGDVDLAFHQRVIVPAGESCRLYFYLSACGSLAAARAASDSARAEEGRAWFDRTARAYAGWLEDGRRAERATFADAGLNTAFDRARITLKNAQNPRLGTIAATTNPTAYQHKTWVRDGAITAIALDACGHHQEAELYWRWMASVQEGDGTWKTTYSVWHGGHLDFVEPEYDSVGIFLYGVYRHCQATRDHALARALAPVVRRSAQWIVDNLAPSGFGPADFSIWEEPQRGLAHHAFTQAWYVAGLHAAQCLAEIHHDPAASDRYARAAASITTALQRSSSSQPAGLWNPEGYYNRAVGADGSAHPLPDASSDILFALGVVDHACGRAGRHIDTMIEVLTHDRYGIARYRGDDYYHTSPFSPAGDEARAPEPMWPQMSMWVAAYEILRGRRAEALARMKWFVRTLGRGYMPHGEAVSHVTGRPVLSSMSAPLTSASYLVVARLYLGRHDPRIVPPIHAAGAYKEIQVAEGAPWDRGQWSHVPYFRAPRVEAARGSPLTTIERVYVANDDANLYLRVDRVAGSWPAAGDGEDPAGGGPPLALRVYSGDFAGGAAAITVAGLSSPALSRPASFLVECRSESRRLRRYRVSAGQWHLDDRGDATAAHCDPTSGRIEAAIPLRALASSRPDQGTAWAALHVELAAHDAIRDAWVGGERVTLNYRLSAPGQPWIHGQVDR